MKLHVDEETIVVWLLYGAVGLCGFLLAVLYVFYETLGIPRS